MWTKHTLLVVSLVLTAIIILVGCVEMIGPSAYPNPILQITTPDPVSSPITSPTPKIIKSTQTPPPEPAAPGLGHLMADALVTQVVADLGKRNSLDPKKIRVFEAAPTNWSDSSLGCPQPGIEYTQVLIRGFRIVLEAKGQRYEYHTGDDERFILCENNQLLIDPVPVMPIAPHGKPPKCQWTQCP